ncbi:MAG: hypothetical protein IPK03_05430 [Bacteroidetes bacterium]|nr:hypothetical protein [Bacteroidota bacterium]
MNQEDYNFWNTPEGFWTLLQKNFLLFEKCKYHMLDNFVEKNKVKLNRKIKPIEHEEYLLYCFALMISSIESGNLYRVKKSIEFYFKNSFVYKRAIFYSYFGTIRYSDDGFDYLIDDESEKQDEFDQNELRVNLVELTFDEMRKDNNLRQCPKFLKERLVEETRIIDIFRTKLFEFSLKTLGRYEKKCKPAFEIIYIKLRAKYGYR